MNHSAHRRQTLYDILGIPCGVGVDHIKDSYRLVTKKTPLTDGAYAVLSDPVKKQRYDAELWAAARIKPTSEPQRHEVSNLTPEQERLLKEWGKSKPWRVELPDGTTIKSEDCITGNPNIMVHEYEICGNQHRNEVHSNCPLGAHLYSNDNRIWYTATGVPYSKPASDRGDIQWHDRGSNPEADEWLRVAKEEFLSLQNPTISYQCGNSSDSDARRGGFTLFWVSGSDHALLLRDESNDMFWSMLDKNYLTQEELRLSLLRWWPALEERDNVDLGEIEMVDERSVTPSAILSYPETRIIRF
jgi:curved DNA-binding protein CbpA